jgi:two-component system nitrogen regulation sensor histidine kinase NtrY
MKTINNRPLLLLTINLITLIATVTLLTILYLTRGLSSTWCLMLLVTFSLLVSLFALFQRQDKQLLQVIRSLANGDNTLGFNDHHPMRKHLDQVKQQMQSARFDAEQKSIFLNALMVHIDLAIIVCDALGNIIESNPAVARLLGRRVDNLEQLGHIGTLIFAAKKNVHSTVQWLNGEQSDTLSLQVSIAEIQGKTRKIITLQSIHEMLLNKEQQAYKRLTRVLTHEVANSITPLASIAQTCQGLMPESLSFADNESKQDLNLALKTLASRSEYLGEFIASFRQISNLPMPNLMPTPIAPILERIHTLHQPQLTKSHIILNIDIKAQQLVMLDSAQIDQVLINLVKNAIEAVQSRINQQKNQGMSDIDQGQITLTVAQNNAQQLYVEVVDNGLGIAEHVVKMIFVPFFTTKQQGSGIGLSLSRQIMINHGGDLVYLSGQQGACLRCIFG